MLRLLQNIKPTSALWVVFFAAALRTPYVFLFPETTPACDSPLFPAFFSWAGSHALWNNLLATFLVCFAALLLNRICINQDVIYTHTYLPAWFYIIISSMVPEQLNLHPLMFSNILILFGFNFLFSLFSYEGPSILIYLTALCFGAAAMFRLQLLVLLPFMLGAIILLKRITPKDLLATVLGISMPVYLLLGLLYVSGLSPTHAFSIQGIQTTYKAHTTLRLWPFAFVFLLVFLSFFKVFANFFKNNIRTRRVNQVLIFYLAYGLVFLLLFRTCNPLTDVCMVFVPTAVFVAYLLVGHKHTRLKNLANLLLLASAIGSLYGSYIMQRL